MALIFSIYYRRLSHYTHSKQMNLPVSNEHAFGISQNEVCKIVWGAFDMTTMNTICTQNVGFC